MEVGPLRIRSDSEAGHEYHMILRRHFSYQTTDKLNVHMCLAQHIVEEARDAVLIT